MSEAPPPDFVRRHLSELAAPGSDTLVDGPFGSSLKSNEYAEDGVRLIQLQNIGDGEWRDENKRFISAYKFNTLARHGAAPGDIAIAKMAEPVARACLVPSVSERYLVVADCIRLRVDRTRFDPGFVFRAINSSYSRREAERKAIGSTRVRINLSVMKTVGCLVPELAVQKAIARVLDTVDTAIQETEASIVKLKAVKQGLLHDLLTRGIDDKGELRPLASEAPHLYRMSPIGWIPKHWTFARLDDLAQRGSGHTPSKSVPSYWNGGIKWVSLADSHRLDNIYISETEKEISAMGLANSSAVLHPAGTVILSRDAGVGKSAVLACEMAVSQHFMAWRCGDRLQNLFLYFYLQRQKPRFEAISLGSTIQTIGLPYFKAYEVAIPPRPEQELIAQALMDAESDLSTRRSEAAKLKELRCGLMDDLLSGRASVGPLLVEAERDEGGA